MLIDLTKQTFETFETFTVIKRVENSPNSRVSRWLCQCKLCKKEFVRYSDALRKGGKCSCCNKKGQKHEWCWKGHEEISGKYWSKLKLKYANSKRKKDINFNVSIEEGWEQFLKQDRRCAITGQQLMFTSDYSRGSSQTASLDRIDSNGHYEIGNIQWVHKDINRLKNDYSEEIFFSLCLKIVQFNELKMNSLNLM